MTVKMWRLSLLLWSSGLFGQALFSVRVEARPAGAPFLVDGIRYTQAQAFVWQKGSRHVLSAETLPAVLTPSVYKFIAWRDNADKIDSLAYSVEVIASEDVQEYSANYQLLHRLDLQFEAGAGTVTVNTQTFSNSGSVYVEDGSNVVLQALPNLGWLFTRWNSQNEPAARANTSTTITAPTVLNPIFGRAAQMTLRTEPADLGVTIDGVPGQSPLRAQWLYDEVRRLETRSPQTDLLGQLWLFTSWDMGHGDVREQQVTLYQVPRTEAITLAARFVRGARARFECVPSGLRINIDGHENWPTYSFIWAVGSTHRVAAQTEQVDVTGARWRFKEWRHGGGAAQTVTVTEAWAGQENVFVAVYEPMAQVRIETDPSALAIEVAGAPCRTPCSHWAVVGGSVSVRVPRSIPLSGGSRLDFANWRDGGLPDRTVVLVASGGGLLARYVRMHPVRGEVTPEGAGEIKGLDEFAAEGSQLSLESHPQRGFRLRHWEGETTGINTTVRLTIRGPTWIRAVMQPVLWADPRGVFGPVQTVEEPWVAPGSRAAILGLNLAEREVLSSSNPLPQFLAGTSVTWGNWLLPLLSVSPERIELAIPWGIPPGPHQFTIRRIGMPETRVTARVRDAAPVLFPNFVPQADGSIVLLATGLGPVTRTPLDGFNIPAGFVSTALSSVEVTGEWGQQMAVAELVPGHIGLFGIRVVLPEGASSARLRSDGFESNAIALRRVE
jgi:uncharacterized protein (TIGR03437 family)